MNVILCILNLFKPKNWLILISGIINVGLAAVLAYFLGYFFDETNAIYYAIGSIALYIIIELVMLTPLGEFILRKQQGMIELPRNEETEELYKQFDSIINLERLYNKNLSSKLKLYYVEDDAINAYALGSRTICLTTGAMQLSYKQIRGLLAHEMGHIHYYDSYVSMIALHGNVLFNAVLFVCYLIAYLFAFIIDGLFTIVINIFTKRGKTVNITKFLLKLIYNLLKSIVSLITLILFAIRSRSVEYRADEYTCKLCENKNLKDVLEVLSEYDVKPRGLTALVLRSHPYIKDRIARL